MAFSSFLTTPILQDQQKAIAKTKSNFSKVVSDSICDTEGHNEEIEDEIQGFKFQRKSTFKSPAKEWNEPRLDSLREILNSLLWH